MPNRWVDEASLTITGDRAVRKASDLTAIDVRDQLPPLARRFRSKWEAAFARVLANEWVKGNIRWWEYEPFSFRLASGKRYRTDFVAWDRSGAIICYEVKGWHRNRRDALTHLVWAAQRFPFFQWRCVWWQENRWQSQDVVP